MLGLSGRVAFAGEVSGDVGVELCPGRIARGQDFGG